MRTCQLWELNCELSLHCLLHSWCLEVLMVISVDTWFIKQLEKQLNVILAISIITWQDDKGNNSILENMSIWPISQQILSQTQVALQQAIYIYNKHRNHWYPNTGSPANRDTDEALGGSLLKKRKSSLRNAPQRLFPYSRLQERKGGTME